MQSTHFSMKRSYKSIRAKDGRPYAPNFVSKGPIHTKTALSRPPGKTSLLLADIVDARRQPRTSIPPPPPEDRWPPVQTQRAAGVPPPKWGGGRRFAIGQRRRRRCGGAGLSTFLIQNMLSVNRRCPVRSGRSPRCSSGRQRSLPKTPRFGKRRSYAPAVPSA